MKMRNAGMWIASCLLLEACGATPSGRSVEQLPAFGTEALITAHVTGAGTVWVAGEARPETTVASWENGTWRAAPLMLSVAPRPLTPVTFDSQLGEVLVGAPGGNFWRRSGDAWLSMASTGCISVQKISPLFQGHRFLTCNYYPFASSVDVTSEQITELDPDPPWILTSSGIWVSGPDELYGLRDAQLSYWSEGSWSEEGAWTAVELPPESGERTLVAFAVVGERQLVGVGHGGLIVRFQSGQGVIEESSSSADLSAVWGSPTDGIFAVGAAGTVLHHDGQVWHAIRSETAEDLLAVHGVVGGKIVAAGAGGFVGLVR